MQTKKGQSIEDASMQMIEDEIGSHEFNEKNGQLLEELFIQQQILILQIKIN